MNRQARSASCMYDQASRRVQLDVTLADGETVTLDLPFPELLADSLQRALWRKRESDNTKASDKRIERGQACK